MSECTYGIAQIHLTTEARKFVQLPRSSTFILPVNFVSEPQLSWSLIIVPEVPIEACQWVRAKVGLLSYEYGARYIQEGAEFTVNYTTETEGTVEIGWGVVVSVKSCSVDNYREMFQYPIPDRQDKREG